MSELVRAHGIGRRAGPSGRWLLHDVSLTVGSGDRILIVGPSGAGKTLLLRAIALLDPLDDGEIRWRGQPVADGSVPDYRSQVAYLQQDPALIEGNVELNLRLPFELACHAQRSFDAPAVRDLLERGGFPHSLLERRTRELSGGERQLVALVRLLQLDPQVLLLDEPTAALDPESSHRVAALIEDWAAGGEARAFVWVGHHPELVRPLATRELRCEAGELSEVT